MSPKPWTIEGIIISARNDLALGKTPSGGPLTIIAASILAKQYSPRKQEYGSNGKQRFAVYIPAKNK